MKNLYRSSTFAGAMFATVLIGLASAQAGEATGTETAIITPSTPSEFSPAQELKEQAEVIEVKVDATEAYLTQIRSLITRIGQTNPRLASHLKNRITGYQVKVRDSDDEVKSATVSTESRLLLIPSDYVSLRKKEIETLGLDAEKATLEEETQYLKELAAWIQVDLDLSWGKSPFSRQDVVTQGLEALRLARASK